MGRLRANTIKNSTGSTGPIFVGPAEFSTTAHVVLPKGTTGERPANPATGALRYNTSTSQVEYWNGTEWIQTSSYARDRGVFAGGNDPGVTNTISYITISSTGNSTDFGDLTVRKDRMGSCSSSTRGVFGGGYTPGSPTTNIIDYITISTTGNATDFGDLTQSRGFPSACSSSTRGVFGGGYNFPGSYVMLNTIDYITISTTGNATDFGDLTQARYQLSACSSNTRGIFGGGSTFPGPNVNTIDYITIETIGNALDFGDLTVARSGLAACSSSTRGVFGGGSPTTNIIDYITIATTGNATDFGDLTVARSSTGSCSSSTRGVFGGGVDPSVIVNTIDYITIASTGNATDFGDLITPNYLLAATSDCHGGLS